MPDPKPKKLDPLVILARASAGRRKRPIWPWVILVLAALGMVGLYLWLVWPAGDYPAVALAVYDQVALPGETISIAAGLEAIGPVETDPRLKDSRLYLEDSSQPQYTSLMLTDSRGYAVEKRRFAPGHDVVEVAVRYPGITGRRRAAQAFGRVYFCPAGTKFLIVDADGLPGNADPDSLWTINNVDLRPGPGIAEALQAAWKTHRIVYLSMGADRPTRSNKLRAWLLGQGDAALGTFPPGPLLASGSAPPEERGSYASTLIADLRRRFEGSVTAVTSNPDLARQLRDAGAGVCLLAAADDSVEGTARIESWDELSRALR